MVTTKGGGGTHQSAITRDVQAPKHKDMRSTIVGGGGGVVWPCGLVRQGGEEGGGWRAGGDAPLVVSLSCCAVEKRSSTKDTKEAVEKSSSWFPLPWGCGSFQLFSATERVQELF